jgi:predicted phage terminase large subunit-like protein
MPDIDNVIALAADDLALYAMAQWPRFQLAAHHALLVDKLEAAARGEISRLMIFMPPRHGKSLISTQNFPAWYLGKFPHKSIITASYSQDLADDFGRRVRNLVSNDVHQAIFPGFAMAGDSRSMRRFDTMRGGSYYATGRGGPITGRGADLLLIDDPLKDSEEARSETIRRGLHEWYQHTAYTRLAPGGVVVIIQTRWHSDDLAGWLLREHPEENWQVLTLPAIAEVDEGFRKAGQALWPSRYPSLALKVIRAAIGGAAWASLYQQRPSAAEGAVFKREWFRTYREVPTAFTKILQSWDTAFKTGAENDFSVCTTWGATQVGYYLLSLWRAKVEFPELKRQFAHQAEAWRPHVILVEDKASGQSLIQELKLASPFPVLPVKVDSDKRTRAEAVTPLFEAGKVFLPEAAPWLTDFIDELASFDSAVHDDQVDSTTQALNYLRAKGEDGFFQHLLSWCKRTKPELLEGTPDAVIPVPAGFALATLVVDGPKTDHLGNPISPEESGRRGGIVTGVTPGFRFEDPLKVLSRPRRPR